MRIIVAVLAPLLLLAACGNEDEIAAKRADLSKVKTQLQALEREYAQKLEGWQPTKEAFIAASQTLKRALLSGDKDAGAAAQAAYDQAQVADRKVSKMERALLSRINELKNQQKKILRAIQALGGGSPDP